MPRIEQRPHSPELPSLNQPQKPSQLAQRQQAAKQAAEHTKRSLIQGHSKSLERLNETLNRAEERREQTLDRLSDRMAYLQDTDVFMFDLLKLTQKKLKANQQPDKRETTETAVDALVDAFDVIGNWEIPAISPSTVAGALPM